MPAAISDITHDANLDIRTNIGSLGKIKAGELAAKGNIVARNVYEKYPGISRDFVTQTMAATYCSMLSSESFTSKQRADRWNTFQTKVLGLSAEPPPPSNSPSGFAQSVSQDKSLQRTDVNTTRQASSKSNALDKLIYTLSDGLVRFQVGTNKLDARSTAYLRAVATRLRQPNDLTISLEPVASKSLGEDALSEEARALYKSRQHQARLVLIGGGFASDQIVFINNMVLGRDANDVYDSEGNSIEAGLVVRISRNGQ